MGGWLSCVDKNINNQTTKNKKKDIKSTGSSSIAAAAANVISINGEFCQFTVPVTVSQVLVGLQNHMNPAAGPGEEEEEETELPTPKNNSNSTSCWFLCSSDQLMYDQCIPALDSEEQLELGQIYFVLPEAKLDYPLTASDMAVLAVKASNLAAPLTIHHKNPSATSSTTCGGRGPQRGGSRKNKSSSRISTLVVMEEVNQRSIGAAPRVSISSNNITRSSPKKLPRYHYSSTSRRAKLAVRSFGLRLTTIYEGSVLQSTTSTTTS